MGLDANEPVDGIGKLALMNLYEAYVICTSPRSGSTLLCELIRHTGVAGSPGSLFHHPSLEKWLGYYGFNTEEFVNRADALSTIFDAAGADLSRPTITTCGSGVTAAILSLALERIGHHQHAVYDGSWTEWGAYPDLAVETG